MNVSGKIEKIVSPFQDLIRDERYSGYLLIVTAIVALVIANSPVRLQYESFLHLPIGFHLGSWSFEKSLQHWVNDGLMAMFFYMLGLEMKREFLVGELKDVRNSITIIAAALGGMVVPAIIFFLFNEGLSTQDGWGIPMATDAAFAVSIMALLKTRIPLALTTFLLALAIIDDLGAIIVIALFYTKTIDVMALSSAGLLFFLLILLNCSGVRRSSAYFVSGVILWFLMEYSGVHATIAGVAVAFATPARREHSDNWMIRRIEWLLTQIKIKKLRQQHQVDMLADEQQHKLVKRLEESAQKVTTPLRRWENSLERPVVLFVLPVFALVNAGIPINYNILTTVLSENLSWGIILGLFVGKPLGITLFCWVSIKAGYGRLPEKVTFQHIIGMAMLGGIGFTMSIFIAGLSFSDQVLLSSAKLSIFIASLISGIFGYAWLRFMATKRNSFESR